MCVTPYATEISKTMVVTYATTDSSTGDVVHYTFYQNQAAPPRFSFGQAAPDGANCMFLPFPAVGGHIELVGGATSVRSLMEDITQNLPTLQEEEMSRGRSLGAFALKATQDEPVVTEFGDYTVVTCSSATRILDVLDQVREDRRPKGLAHLRRFAAFLSEWYPDWGFALPCFKNGASPTHPIALKYRPLNPDVLFAPGLDGHTGQLPVFGEDVLRNFRVAFAVDGVQLPVPFRVNDFIMQPPLWVPNPQFGVAGFHDNRAPGSNGDYCVDKAKLLQGLSGHALADALLPMYS